MTMKLKFFLLGALLVMIVTTTEWINYENKGIARMQEGSANLIQRHMDADMKHDGIRGNVYSALVAAQTGDQELLKSSQEEVATMADEFAKLVDENIAADIPADIKAQFAKIKQSVATYKDSSIKISNQANDFNKALAMLPEFNNAFDVLEEDQGKATEMVMAWSGSVHASAEAMNRYLDIALTALFIIAIGLPVFAMLSIFKPLNIIMASMQKLSDGNTSTAIPYTRRSDEIGGMARTVKVFQDTALKVESLNKESEAAKLLIPQLYS